MSIELRPYQRIGAKFLATRPGAILNFRVGLGKTAVAIKAAHLIKAASVLLIVPKVLKDQWITELEKFETALNNVVHFTVQPSDYLPEVGVVTGDGYTRVWTLTHYEQYINSSAYLDDLLAQSWDVVICDEVHKIKNRKAQRTSNITDLKAKYRWGLTGTALAERPTDLWGLLHWVDDKQFPHYWPWVGKYCEIKRSNNYQEVEGVKYTKQPNGLYSTDVTLAMLRAETRPYILSRTLEDVKLDLPPIQVNDITLTMNDDQRSFYKEVEHATFIALTSELPMKQGVIDVDALSQALVIRDGGARFTRLHQTASAPTTFRAGLSNAKLEWLSDYIEGGGEPAVIFTRYRHTVDTINAHLKTLGTKNFVVHTYAKGSTGLNLQHLNNMILFDTTYSRLEYEQALGRIHRIGQTKPCQVYRLINKGTVDRRVAYMIDHKQSIVTMVLTWLRGCHDIND